MRVYTGSTVRTLVSYIKLLFALSILGVSLFAATKIWSNDPSAQELKNLLKIEQAE